MDSVVHGVVVVPLISLPVGEDDVVGEIVVMIEDICEIYHGLSGFVTRDAAIRIGSIGDIYVALPVGEMGVYPGCVLIFRARNDQRDGLGLVCIFDWNASVGTGSIRRGC